MKSCAGQSKDSPNKNTAIGVSSIYKNTTGTYSTPLGETSVGKITVGQVNSLGSDIRTKAIGKVMLNQIQSSYAIGDVGFSGGLEKNDKENYNTRIGPDTLCFHVDTLKKVFIAASERNEYKLQNELLNERLSLKDQVIFQMNSRDSLVRVGYENQMSLLRQELDLRKDQVNGYEKLLRKERRKRRAVAAAGIAATGILTYLLITK